MDTSCLIFALFALFGGFSVLFFLRATLAKRRARKQLLKLAHSLRDTFQLTLEEGETAHTLRDDTLTISLSPCNFKLLAPWPSSSPFWDDSILIKATNPDQNAAVWKDIRLGLAAHTKDPDFDSLYTVYAHDPQTAAADLPLPLRRVLCEHHHDGTHVDFEGVSITLRPKSCRRGFSLEECSLAIRHTRSMMHAVNAL